MLCQHCTFYYRYNSMENYQDNNILSQHPSDCKRLAYDDRRLVLDD